MPNSQKCTSPSVKAECSCWQLFIAKNVLIINIKQYLNAKISSALCLLCVVKNFEWKSIFYIFYNCKILKPVKTQRRYLHINVKD